MLSGENAAAKNSNTARNSDAGTLDDSSDTTTNTTNQSTNRNGDNFQSRNYRPGASGSRSSLFQGESPAQATVLAIDRVT